MKQIIIIYCESTTSTHLKNDRLAQRAISVPVARVENHKNPNLNLGQADIKGAHKKTPIQYGIYYQKTPIHIGKIWVY
jgi:hypothetical protein